MERQGIQTILAQCLAVSVCALIASAKVEEVKTAVVPCKHAAHLVHHITWQVKSVKLQRHPEFGVQLVPDVSAWADTTLKFIRCWILVHWEMMTLRLTVIPFSVVHWCTSRANLRAIFK
jgi:hypothetical protein